MNRIRKARSIPILLWIIVAINIGCTKKGDTKYIVVKNTLNIDRSFETVAIPISSLGVQHHPDKPLRISVTEVATKKELITQTIDSDGDGTVDQLLFQPKINAFSEKYFEVAQTDKTMENDPVSHCYSRFVPERTDDYAWENNRVAFRTYGPAAQKMAEDNVKGGTLSSGIDAWLKRVDYPIINAWYKKTVTGTGSYHKDTGEGLDNFHVGSSRGVGGTAIRVDSTYYISKNFTSWKTLYNGPIRTGFVLTYTDWDAAGRTISEEKHISLDYGSNLSRFDVFIRGTDTISVGLTLHKKEGTISTHVNQGWISYWEPLEDSEIGMGIVAPENTMVSYDYYVTNKKDRSNLYAHIRTGEENRIVYYAGFGWKKSSQFQTKEAWENYLSSFARKINTPLLVAVK